MNKFSRVLHEIRCLKCGRNILLGRQRLKEYFEGEEIICDHCAVNMGQTIFDFIMDLKFKKA